MPTLPSLQIPRPKQCCNSTTMVARTQSSPADLHADPSRDEMWKPEAKPVDARWCTRFRTDVFVIRMVMMSTEVAYIRSAANRSFQRKHQAWHTIEASFVIPLTIIVRCNVDLVSLKQDLFYELYLF